MFRRTLTAVVTALLCSTLGLRASTTIQKPITASDAWVKALPDGTATAFAVVDNPTMYDVYLVSASADIADEVRFREPEATGSTNTKEVKEITAPAYSKAILTPGGTHLTLDKLKRQLKVGETIVLTLTTDGGLVLQVPAVVK